MLNWKPLFLAFALGLAFGGPAGADSDAVVVETPWARATPPGAPSAAGYLTIHNTGAEPDRLLAADSTRAARVEMHQMTIADGVARMRPLPEGIEIGPGDSVVLAPGGLHLMFREPESAFVAGESVPVTLTFDKAGDRRVELPVVPIGAGPPAGHDGHDAHR